MHAQKVITWVLIFSVLSSYSFYVLAYSGSDMQAQAAYAKSISAEPAFEEASIFLVFENRYQSALERVLGHRQVAAGGLAGAGQDG